MKCDEPKVYKVYTTRNEGAFGFCEDADPTDIELEHESVCLKSDVDKVITQLKEELHDVDNQWNEQCKEIAQLKAENLNFKAKNIELQSFYNLHGNVDNYIDKLKAENEQLKEKLDSVQATAYAESVDAGMRERRLRRALWLMGARLGKMGSLAYHNIKAKLYFFDDTEGVKWALRKREQWENVESKCLAKSEEYK